MTQVYKCPHCGATGTDILYMNVTTNVDVYFNLETDEYDYVVGDWEYANVYMCSLCDQELDDHPDNYIQDVEE